MKETFERVTMSWPRRSQFVKSTYRCSDQLKLVTRYIGDTDVTAPVRQLPRLQPQQAFPKNGLLVYFCLRELTGATLAP